MNEGNSVSTGTTTPKPPLNWLAIAVYVLSLIATGMGTHIVGNSGATGKPSPAVTTPAVNHPVAPDSKTSPTPAVDPLLQLASKLDALLAGQDVVLQNQLKPAPAVEVPATPPKPATPAVTIQTVQPAAAITVTQGGKPVTSGTVDAGKLFSVAGTGVTSWANDQDANTDADLEPTPTGFMAVIRKGSVLFIGTTENGIVKQRVSVAAPAVVTPQVNPVNPQPSPGPGPPPTPVPVSTAFDFGTAAGLLADEATKANVSPAFKASSVVQGMLNVGDWPADFVAKIKAACPGIDANPARDLTDAEVTAIRGVK